MKAETWKNRITNACKDAGTYKPYFDSVIKTLSTIMEQRDIAYDQFIKEGGKTTITQINKGGNEYTEKNPLYVVVRELNMDALAYWRDLGLTPAGLKKIDEAALKGKKKSALAEALRELGG